jgi:glycosyltransferase involved in cell wall biosynthesis
MKRILILYKFLPQYRVDFFNILRNELYKDDIELNLIYGKNKNSNALKNDEKDIEWAHYVPNRVIWIGKLELIWQPVTKYLKGNDVIIVEQANSLVINYYLIIARHFLNFKLAFWGHGRNMQDNAYSLKNKFKYFFIHSCDWWFAYTECVKNMLIDHKYPSQKITVVQNAIDTVMLCQLYQEVTQQEIDLLKLEIGIQTENAGIYCGGMYPDKRLDFIVEVLLKVKKEVPDFHMIFIGSGIDASIAARASEEYKWIHYMGPKFGKERVKYFKISSVQIMPGAIGLGILDSFAMETPIITTYHPCHGPEFEYLEDNINGIVTNDSLKEYSDAIIQVLKTKKYKELSSNCKLSAQVYTIEKMVTNFRNGILLCSQGQKVAVA